MNAPRIIFIEHQMATKCKSLRTRLVDQDWNAVDNSYTRAVRIYLILSLPTEQKPSTTFLHSSRHRELFGASDFIGFDRH